MVRHVFKERTLQYNEYKKKGNKFRNVKSEENSKFKIAI